VKAFKPIVILSLAVLLMFSAKAQVKDDSYATDPTKAIRLFPNPAVDFVSVRFETPLANIVQVSLHDIIGNEIPVEMEVYGEYEIHLKIKDLPTGYYLVTVKQEEGSHRSILKFLKR
jgi:Secretion system C-terminal sorting domain